MNGDGLGEGYGMLGQAGSGKLRISMGQSKLAAKVAKRFKEKNYGSSGATSGLTSSLAFTPVQVSSSRIHRLMHTNSEVELKAPTSLKREHFQKSRGSDPRRRNFLIFMRFR